MKLEWSEKFKKSWGSTPSFDELMALDGQIYRAIARRKTFKFERNGQAYFAKIHQGVGWGEILKNLIRLRLPVLGAKNEYDAIAALTAINVNTMTLAAYGQRGWNPAELESVVITESLEPSMSLEDYCADWRLNKPDFKLKQALICQVASMSKRMHGQGINHRDLYICHFLMKEGALEQFANGMDICLYLIDLHRVQIRDKVPLRWQVKDLAALYFSSMDIGLTKRDLYRFIKVYSKETLKNELTVNKHFWQRVEKRALSLYAKHGIQ
jgi:heptose I phosphotransferase